MARPLIDYTGRTVGDAKVLGRVRVEGESRTIWCMRCNHCGQEFTAASKQLKHRRHSHACDDGRKGNGSNSITGATASVRLINETTFHVSGPIVAPMAIASAKLRRSLTPAERGLLEAKNFLGVRGLSGNF